MCNNIPANKISVKGEERVDYSIESEIFKDRPILPKNTISKILSYLNEDKIIYRKGHPLKLGDKSRVYEISSVILDKKHKEFYITFCFDGKRKRETVSIIRFKKDKVEDVENFLLHAFSVYELRNIDLRYMHK